MVLGVTGVVEVLPASGKGWLPLAAASALRPGDRIRTGMKSFADFGFDSALGGMARLGEKSRARLAGPVWELERGKVWALWEYENGSRGPFEVRSAGVSVRIEGGAYVHADPGRLEVRSFGQTAVGTAEGRPGAGELEEGWRGIVSGGVAAPAQRLTFADYEDWRAWMVEAYRYKDSRVLGNLP